LTLETRTLVLISAAVVINIVAGQVVRMLNIPLYLDSVGTVLVAVLAGPLAGGLTGLVTNLIWGLILTPVAAAFAPVAIVTGLCAGWLARVGWFKTWWQALISGVLISIPSTIVAVPIIVFMFGGVTGGGPDYAVAYLAAVGSSIIKSVAFSNLGVNTVDKSLTALVAFVVISRLPIRLTTSYGFFAHSRA
jgi:energy-coupling factor transport system substrate-specific component